MLYFTCNESKIYESFTFWNKLQEKLFHDILIYWDAPVHLNLKRSILFDSYLVRPVLHLWKTAYKWFSHEIILVQMIYVLNVLKWCTNITKMEINILKLIKMTITHTTKF